jgi:hypothetical protein
VKGPSAQTLLPVIPYIKTQRLRELNRNTPTVARTDCGLLRGPIIQNHVMKAFMESRPIRRRRRSDRSSN